MKEYRFRLILILGAVVLSLYLLYPTYVNYNNQKAISKIVAEKEKEIKASNPQISADKLDSKLKSIEDSLKNADPSINKMKLKSLKLGLDLQGGMRVVLEVNTGKLLEKLAKNPDDVFKTVMKESEKEATVSEESMVNIVAKKFAARGIRLSRYFGNIRQSDSEIISELQKDANDAVTRAMEIIRNRVDQYGVSEPTIQRQGSRRIIVELPGIAREEEAKQLLQGTALLEFKLVKDPELTISIMKKIDDVLAGTYVDSTKSDSSLTKGTTAKTKQSKVASTDTSNKQLSAEEFAAKHPFFAIAMLDPKGKSADAYVKGDDRDKLQLMLNRPEVQQVIPNNVQFVFSAKPIANQNGQPIYMLYCVNKNPELTGG
ncbi:MAG: preprotein translocase subunit SecD, partial [Ignavibacteriaceae bacterium]